LFAQDVKIDRARRTEGGRKPVEKNARNNRGHRDSSGARHRWRSDHRAEVDPQDHREDRRNSSGDRRSGLGQYGRPYFVPDGFLSTRQPSNRPTPTPAPTAINNSSISARCGLASSNKVFPSSSVDSKKRELIGNFKNAGAKWDRSPVLVNDHDFRSDASGVGISYGIYDPPHNRGACAPASPGVAPIGADRRQIPLAQTRGALAKRRFDISDGRSLGGRSLTTETSLWPFL
jgi:hypothetical protein